MFWVTYHPRECTLRIKQVRNSESWDRIHETLHCLLNKPFKRTAMSRYGLLGPFMSYPPFTRTVELPIFVMSDWFCQAVRLILPGSPTDFEIGIFLSLRMILCNSCPTVSQRFQMKLSINMKLNIFLYFLVHTFIESFIWNLWLTIGHELHKIGWRDRKIPISKISRRAWQNQTDGKNWTL